MSLARQLCGAGLVVLLGAAPARAGEVGRRWALVVGENAGEGADEKLRYAERDARRVLQVFQELGSVTPKSTVALYGANAQAVRAALAQLGERLRQEAGAGDQLILYFSSHADEGALHLAGSRLPVAELTDFLARAPVGVALLVLDSCRSGAVTRLKGLTPLGGAQVQVDAASIEGRVVLSSSGPDEYAQESEELQGSYFTHHLVAALRGAADRSGDGRVTLEEAYGYAYARTVESTFATRGGIQRPSYRVDLRGHGELVLSELQGARGRLAIEVAAPGQWLVVSADGTDVLAQLDKGSGPSALALPPGSYEVRAREEGGFRRTRVTIPASGTAVLREQDLRAAPLVKVARKGAPEAIWVAGVSVGAASPVVYGLGLLPGVDVSLARVGTGWGRPRFALTLGYRDAAAPGEAGFRQREVELSVSGALTAQLGRLTVLAGPYLAGLLALQTEVADGQARTALAPSGGVLLGAQLPLGAGFGLALFGQGGGVLVRTVEGTRVSPRAAVSVGATFEL